MRAFRVRWLVFSAIGAVAFFRPAIGSDCAVTSVGLVPLNDLGTGLYLGQFQGGLYPGGSNEVPANHAAIGLARARGMIPLSTSGQPDPAGRIVLLSIGMSNTTQEFCSQSSSEPCDAWTFTGQATADPHVNHATLSLINGARGGQTPQYWDSPTDSNYDTVRDQRLAPKGLTEAQVQVAWIKEADPQPKVSLPSLSADAYVLEAGLGNVLRAMKTRYPNLKLVFLSSRIYAGYATGVSALNPEPYAYEGGFSVKWLIEAQIRQMSGGGVDSRAGNLDFNTAAPWLAWGPYLWADGTSARSDGLVWECADLQSDGTHPARSGEQKVGTMLLDFMLTSPFAVPWFRAHPAADFDRDGHVDQADFGHFEECLTGPELGPLAQDCGNADFDDDGDVDQSDFGVFQRCVSGLGEFAKPGC